MKISRHWLHQFAHISDISDQEFSRLFNIRTAELDGVENQAQQFENMVIGQIQSIASHPNADKLRVTQTNIGQESVQIVCGASNIKEGMKVIVALPGSKVRWHGEGDLIELKETELRGVKSVGMICGADEVGLPNKVDGVADMSELDCAIGTPLAEALGKNDTIIEIDNKSLTNRPDLWGHYGLARECAVIWQRELKALPVYEGDFGSSELKVTVTDSKLCPRYMALRFTVESINNAKRIADFLSRIGLNSHGLLVDLTNYILHELGQPLHAFDATKVKGAITVRPAKTGEKIVTLDEVERTLNDGMLVICDEEKILAIAGVMGGLASAITAETKEVILEAANFDPVSVRTTAQKLALRTDAVQRYEKSLDPYLPETALKRFLHLLEENATISINSAVTDIFPNPPRPLQFVISPERITKRIGAPIALDFIKTTLQALGFTIEDQTDSSLLLTVPSFRATKDISSEADIVEEIARLYGYEKIEPSLPTIKLTLPPAQTWLTLEQKIKYFLAQAYHLNEVYHYSFYGPKELQRFGYIHEHVMLLNSLSEEHTHLRTNLLPGMLEGLSKNSTLFDQVKVFEIGKVYLPRLKGELPDERAKVGILYSDKNNSSPFYAVKQIVDSLFSGLHIKAAIKPYQPKAEEQFMQSGRAASIVVANQDIGYIFELSAIIRDQYKAHNRIAFAEIDFEEILKLYGKSQHTFKPIAKFPSKLFDVSVIVSKDSQSGVMVEEMSAAHPLIENVELFDVFEDESLGQAKKALAFKVTLQAQDRTLTDDDMHTVQKLLFDYLMKEHQGVIRGLE